MTDDDSAPEELPPPLTITTSAADSGRVLVVVSGELDLATAHQLTDAVEQAHDGTSEVELDLEQVRFIDSSGVGAIVVAHRALAAVGARLRIGRRSAIVERVLEVSGVERALGD